MPLYVTPNGGYAFRCINHELPSHHAPPTQIVPDGSLTIVTVPGAAIDSMTFDERWLNLTGVEPPVPPTDTHPGRGAIVNLNRGQPVRAYRCTICGYIELYDAHDVSPDVWGA